MEYAKIDGARLEFNKTAVEITEEGVIFAASDDPENKRLINSDSVIVAVGQGPRSFIVSTTKGIDVLESGLVTVDESGHTSREGVFAGGDVVTGAKTVVEAVVAGRKVALAIDEFMIEKYEQKAS
jgi:glutamate synthase (NADPH/NADH) small chain